MGAEKVVRLNSEHETEMLRNENEVLRSLITESTEYNLKGLREEVQTLKTENIQLKAVDAEKDKLITEKQNIINILKSSISEKATLEANRKIQTIKNEYETKLRDAKSNGSKKVRGENKALKDSLMTQQEMYDNLLAEFSQVNDKLDVQTTLLYQIIDIINSSASISEAKEEIAEVIQETVSITGISCTNNRKPTKDEKAAFTSLVNRLAELDMTNKQIAEQLFNEGHPFLVSVTNANAREQKVGRYMAKKY